MENFILSHGFWGCVFCFVLKKEPSKAKGPSVVFGDLPMRNDWWLLEAV